MPSRTEKARIEVRMHTEPATPAVAPKPETWRTATADYLREIWEYRHFWICLVKADLQRRYRRSVLGVGWSLAQPIAMTVILSLVYSKLLKMDFAEFGPMLLTGFAVWHYVHGAAHGG